MVYNICFLLLSLCINKLGAIEPDNVHIENNYFEKEYFEKQYFEKDFNNNNTKCCVKCKQPQVKFYSIDHKHGFCGEACLNPKFFYLYKFFEPNIKKSNESMSCVDNQYTHYNSTFQHKLSFIKVNVDLYQKQIVQNTK